MQVKHLYAGIASLIVGICSAFGATMTAESAYFRVDTTSILLSASDGTVPGGIEVKWTDNGFAQYELFRGLAKDGPFNRIALVSTNAYFDSSVEWGRPYWYYVSPLATAKSAAPKGRGASNIDDGTGKNAKAPEITKVELPEFWLLPNQTGATALTNDLKITWNEYDVQSYKISDLKITVSQSPYNLEFIFTGEDIKTDSRGFMVLESPTRWSRKTLVMPVLDVTKPSKKSTENDNVARIPKPGEWKVTVEWKTQSIHREPTSQASVYDVRFLDENGGKWKSCAESKGKKIFVFFEKYKSQFGKPNWWYWWQKADQADIKCLREFNHDPTIEERSYAGQCRAKDSSLKYKDIITKTPPSGFPCIYKLKSNTFEPEYLISDLAPCAGKKYSAKANGYQGREVGSDHVGIAALASVIAHERKHGEIKADLYNHEGMYLFRPKDCKTAKKRFTKVSDVIDELRVQQKDAPSFQINDYLSKVLEADSSGDVITDFDCDGVRDDWEVSKYNSLPNEPDTFGFQKAASGFGEYAAYGDNEVLAREAETEPVQFKAPKDYAIPGINRLPELQYLKKKDLESEAKYKNELSKSQFSTTSKMARGVKNPAGDSLTEESIQAYSGVAESLPEVTDYTDVSGVSISRIGCVPPCANTNGLYESLQYCITLTNAQDMSVRVDVKGYLVDTQTNVVAWAESFFEAESNGVSTVNLVFDGRILSGVCATGFSLRCLTLHAVSEQDPLLYASMSVVDDSQVDIASSAFVKYELRLLSETASLFPVWSSNGTCRINFVCDVENNCGAAYYIRARLEDSSGIFLTEAQSATFVSDVTNMVSVTFDSSDIYLAYRNGGDLEISSLWLVREDIGTVEIANKIAVMPEVPRESFRTEENFLSIPEDMEVKTTVSCGTDGLVDALSFSFDVESALDASESCNIWGTLSNTNGDICATEIVPYVFRKGTNTASLSFSGVTIGASGHDGPYVLSDVQFRMSDSGRTIECMTPSHDSIDLKASDFGGVPFTVKGEPQYRMATDDSPAAVVVTVDVARPDTITATVLLVDGEGQYVATARTVVTVSVTGERTLTLVFDPNEINASGRRGPYTISYLLLTSGIEGVEDIRVEDFEVHDVGDSVLKVFVDAATGDDANDGATTATAKRTIQAAVEAIEADGDRVVVADGVYEPFTCENKSIVIESANGSRYAIIDGGGTNRCATLGTSGGQTNTVLRGFTLRNGNANGSAVSTARTYGGGAYGGTLENCVVANCEAQYGGGVCDANLTNCSIVGNRAGNETNSGYGGGVYWSCSGLSASSCYIADNRAYYGSAVYMADGISGVLSRSLVVRNTALCQGTVRATKQYGLRVADCTIAENNSAPGYRSGTMYVSSVDSIIHNNYYRNGIMSSNSSYGSVTNCCTTVEGSTCIGTGIVTEPPAFVDRAGRIYDLLASSGENIVGAGRVVETNGQFKVTVEIDGFGVVTRPGAVVALGSAFELVAEETGRAFEGFYTNGVFVTANRVLELVDIQFDVRVTARFAKRTAYVAETGDDANDGLTSATAKRTIHAVLPLVENGESIEVAPGTYAPIAPTGYASKGKSIRIYSTHGAAQTVIDGGGTNRCADLSDCYGGTTNAVLRGFTLRNGYTTSSGGGACYGTLVDCVVVGNESVRAGGGAYSSRLENCVVVRNRAGTYGGGLYSCTANRSTICGNTTDGYGGGTFSGTLTDSIVDQNVAGAGGDNWQNGSFNACCTSPSRGANPVLGDPLLVDGWNGDARLRVGSPCFVDGVQVCGADVGAPVEGVSVSVGVQGTGAVSDETFLVSNGDSVTIAATETVRPFLYWDLGGEVVSDRVHTLTNVTADVRAVAVFEAFDWFADATAGDDANDGFGWNTAKRTLQAAIDEAVDGESIYVEAGAYAPISTGNKRIRIESLYGAEATFLDGGGTNRCATLALVGIQTNSALVGFTLLNGQAKQDGGGSYGGTLDSCVISNCVAGMNSGYAYGGGAYGGALNNCLVAFNLATASYSAYGGGTYGTRLRSCTVARNTAKGASGYAHGGGVYGDSYSAYNTIVWDNEVDAPNARFPNAQYAYLYNCCTDDTSYYLQGGTITNDPQFVDADAGNFRLKAGSPCLNAGNNSYVQGETDLDWNDRIQDGRVDMGCYEGAAYAAPPGEVAGLHAVRGVLTWDALLDAEGYMIYRSTRRIASSAKYIGTSDANAYTDETAEEDVVCYYWVRAFNALGMGPMGAASEMTWPEVLTITTDALPEGMENEPYEVQLEAKNGTRPYSWSLMAPGYGISRSDSTFSSAGFAQGWQADDKCWELALPFSFPFYGTDYRKVYVSSNGTLAFDGTFSSWSYSFSEFTSRAMIAVLWKDLKTSGGDIYVDASADSVTIQWAAFYLSGDGAVNVSATLYADGRIRLSYGYGNASGGAVGISAGNGLDWTEIDGTGASLSWADDIVLTPGQLVTVDDDAVLPRGMTLSEDGLLSGRPMVSFSNDVIVCVTDADGEWVTRTFALNIAANPNLRPVIETSDPDSSATGGTTYVLPGATQTFSVAATDPEGAALAYEWRIDGEVVEGATGPSFDYSPDGGDFDGHTVECFVSDGYWFDEVSASWDVKNARKWYVDASATTDDGEDADPDEDAGTTSETAFASIGRLLDWCDVNDGDVVLVAPGVYEPFSCWQSVTIKALSGPTDTIIDGGGDSGVYGNEVWGVWVDEDAGYAIRQPTLEGFTIRKCQTAARGVRLVGCKLTEMSAQAASGCRLEDCTVVQCDVAYSLFERCKLTRCSVVQCEAAYSLIERCNLTRCTVAGNTVGENGEAVSYDCHVDDSIVYGNVTADGEAANYDSEAGWWDWDGTNDVWVSDVRFANSCTWPMPRDGASAGNITNDPWLVDVANGDARLRVGSPCLDADGVQTMGAYLGAPVAGHVLSVRIEGNGSVSPMTAVVTDGGSATFSVTNAARPFLGFSTNGVFATAEPTFSWSDVTADGLVTAAFSNFTFHVDATTGDDANDGLSWDTAKRTIQAAIDSALDGEAILVTAGTYAPISTDNKRVRIESLHGAEATFLDGGGTNRCATLATFGGQKDSALVGFTLLNGNARLYGGGSYGGTLECCVISNCVAGKSSSSACGGGAYSGRLVNCLIAGNEAGDSSSSSAWGGGAYSSALLNCTVVGNRVFGSRGDGGGLYWGSYQNTIICGNTVTNVANDVSYLRAGNFVGGDPQFVDVANGDYRLRLGSPCVDAGTSEYAQGDLDLAGNWRVQGAAIDIGAYEFAQAAFVERSVVELSSARQDYALAFRAESAWRASSSASWLVIGTDEGQPDSALQRLALSVEANDTGATRTAEVTLRVGTTNCVVSVRQLAKATVPAVSQRYYGLFVGLNEYEYASSLGGCVGDATNLLARCVSHGFWDGEDVSAMTDSQATKAAVRERISRLATAAKAGDIVLLYQSGHGGNVEDSDGNLTDDVYLCEYDEPYYDYELAEDLGAFKSGVRVVVVIDACHSGGMFKAAKGKGTSAGWRIAQRVNALMQRTVRAKARLRSGVKDDAIDPNEIGWMTACDSDQYSYDTSEGGEFTSGILDGWRSGAADESPFGDGDGFLNFLELFAYAREAATGYGDTDPQCLNEAVLIKTLVGVSDSAELPERPGVAAPFVVGDDAASVTGDATSGWTVTPSEGVSSVVVTIPSGVNAAKVTVKVSPETKRVTPNGAAVKVVRGEADITDYLDIPAADASGVIDLTAATVKEEIAKEPLDAAKGAIIDFASPSKPSLTTAPTREGLVYRLKEGTTLEAMAADADGATKIGDGTSWTPTLSVTGGTSGFYTIEVTK